MGKLKHLCVAACMMAIAAVNAQDKYVPAEWNLKAREKFAEQRFGIFIHWGLYANYAQGEWYLQHGRLNEAAYSRMMYGFYPSKFDAREWVKTFKKAGAKYVTITSRHHDGFSLWPTKVDDGYNIANTPFKRDILGEIATACHEEGLQLNFYYSLMDWHRKDYPPGDIATSVKVEGRNPDYASYKKFMMAQISELIDNYKPGNIWFDGEWEHKRFRDGKYNVTLDWEFDDIYDLIHSKKTLVANNHHFALRDKEDIQIFERDLPGVGSLFSKNSPVVRDRPLEQCDVIQSGVWGYKIGEGNFLTSDQIVAMAARSASKGANLLMNIGPDGSGMLPKKAVESLEGCGAWFEKNGESIYATQAGGIGLGSGIVSTRRGNILYIHFLDTSAEKFAFGIDGEVASATYLATGEKAKCETTPSGDVVVTIKREKGDKFDIVVRVEVK
ncbi:MAG: alpha-L-fucosidase [Kiritimatiellae bacterium]|nr:alpha-L-fucosidase [Kiritimatiellia bacterium]